jgi:transcription antitermination factor NusG
MQFGSTYPWFALHVHTRREPVVQRALDSKSYETFLPTYKECRQYADRVRKIDSALFPGYLFCRLNLDDRLPVLITPGVYDIVRAGEALQPVEDVVIAAIQRVVTSGCNAKPWPFLKAGDKVRVQFGSLAGVEGVLISEKGVDRVVLSISMLQRSVAVEIERSWIQPLVQSQKCSTVPIVA